MRIEEIVSIPVEEAKFCVVDVETTGLSPKTNKIIEIGLVKIDGLKITDRYNSLLNPGRLVPNFITGLTGITNDDIFDAPFFEEIENEISEFVGDDIITGHNLSFDTGFLKKEYYYCKKEFLPNLSLCTLRIANRLYSDLKSKSLGSVSSFLKIKNRDSHRALGDAEVTARILIRMIKELSAKEEIKTIGDLINYQYSPRSASKRIKIKKELSEDVYGLPDAPGIYTFLNSKNDIIYIGKAKSLRNRVKSYFSTTATRKTKQIIKQSKRLKIEITNSELTALLAEAEAIKLINPKHNKQLKKYGNKYFLRINKNHKFPLIEICNHFDFDGNDYFGLFISRRRATEIFEMVQRAFALRECTDKEFNQGKACFLAEIERCTAPCVNKNDDLYNNELEKVYEFLYGKNQFALTRLINKMKEYSDRQKYEKAAETKALIDLLLSQTHKSSLLAEPVNCANVLFEISEGQDKDYILMLSGKIFIKKNVLKNEDNFDEAIDDYYNQTLNVQINPDDEDLEKMKITLNWLVKNRNKVRAFYLKDYKDKKELYGKLSEFNPKNNSTIETTFEIKNFIKTPV